MKHTSILLHKNQSHLQERRTYKRPLLTGTKTNPQSLASPSHIDNHLKWSFFFAGSRQPLIHYSDTTKSGNHHILTDSLHVCDCYPQWFQFTWNHLTTKLIRSETWNSSIFFRSHYFNSKQHLCNCANKLQQTLLTPAFTRDARQ
jgi:hypothetical protein